MTCTSCLATMTSNGKTTNDVLRSSTSVFLKAAFASAIDFS